MLHRVECNARPAFFLSDAHLGAKLAPEGHEESLLTLLQEAADQAGALFLLGDLFDFWFEYRHAIPKGTFRVSRILAQCVDRGIPVIYLGGNHDYWAGSYLREELGVRAFPDSITVQLQGRTVHLAHGDGLGPGDIGYKILKKILRHPLAIAGYRSIHPDLGIPLARALSQTGGEPKHDRRTILPRLLTRVVRPRLQGEVTAMIMGHVHEPTHFRSGRLDYLLIGDWIENMTHVRMEEGVFTLYRRVDGGHEPIASEEFPDWF